MSKTRVSLIGCGRIGSTHLQALKSIEEVELAAVADESEAAAKSFAASAGCPAYTDYREMIDKAQPEVVCICTPPVSHPEIAIYALEHGAHVLCEKPFAIHTVCASRMVEAAEKAGRYLTMASKFRFVEDVGKARELVDQGVLGQMVLAEIAFCGRADMRGRWNSDSALSGGGVLIDNGSHAVDIIRYLLGPISRVQAQHGRNIQALPVEDTSMVFVETLDGVWGRIDLSWSIEKDHDAYICMHGNEGMLVVGWKSSRYRRYDSKEWVTFGNGYNKLDAFTRQHKNFIDSIHGQAKPVINANDSFESVRVVEVAYRSSALNKWVEVTRV
ncbi:MAG: Gfo/Idh/MocA family protein [Acidobacteriaceae bacterium]